MLKTIELSTARGEELIDITESLREAVAESGVQEGFCIVYVPHTTAGITVNACVDAATLADIVAEVRRLVPIRADFQHTFDTPSDAAAHIKTTLIGNSVELIITDGWPLLSRGQGVLFFEFDGPRQRRVLVRIVATD